MVYMMRVALIHSLTPSSTFKWFQMMIPEKKKEKKKNVLTNQIVVSFQASFVY